MRITLSSRMKFNFFWLGEFVLGEKLGPKLFRSYRKKTNKEIFHSLASEKDIPLKKVRCIENVDVIPHKELKKIIYKSNEPILLKGAAKEWIAFKKWDLDFFSSKYGDYELVCSTSHLDRGGSVKSFSMKEYISKIKSESKWYARFSKFLHDHPELNMDLNKNFLKSLLSVGEFWNGTHFFIGPGQTTTGFHCAMASNFFVQLKGEKIWRIYSNYYNPLFMAPVDRCPTFRSSILYERPDFKKDELFKKLDGYEVKVEEGDILYNPPFFWHHVQSESASISISCRFISPLKSMRSSAILLFMTIFATKPSAFSALFSSLKKGDFLNFYNQKNLDGE